MRFVLAEPSWYLLPAVLAGGGVLIAGVALAWWVGSTWRRRRSLQDLQGQLGLAPAELDGARQERVRSMLEPFELPHNAQWHFLKLWQGDWPGMPGGRLELLQMRGDPFNLPNRNPMDAELPLTLLVLQRPSLQLPKFVVVPRNMVTKRMKAHEDTLMDFGDPFTHHNALIGPDRAALRRRFTLAVRNVLRRNTRYTIEGVEDRLLVYQFPQYLSAEQVEDALKIGSDLAAAMAPPGPEPG